MHSSATFLIEFGAIILGLGLLGRLAGRLQFSPIPLYLLAGLAFGEGGLLPLGASAECGELAAGIGQPLLETAQVRLEELPYEVGVRAGPAGQHQPDVRQRHAGAAQPGQQPGLLELLGGVPAVAADRIHPGGDQDTGTVVEPQGAHAQPAVPGRLTDAAHLVLHPPHPGASTRSRVKSGPARSGGRSPRGRGSWPGTPAGPPR
ncbi:hypothetical protein SGRIM128S_06620 [Streptomyces griseomycini]